MLKPTVHPKKLIPLPLPAPNIDIVIAVILALLPLAIEGNRVLDILSWGSIIYLVGSALIYKFFSVKKSQK